MGTIGFSSDNASNLGAEPFVESCDDQISTRVLSRVSLPNIAWAVFAHSLLDARVENGRGS